MEKDKAITTRNRIIIALLGLVVLLVLSVIYLAIEVSNDPDLQTIDNQNNEVVSDIETSDTSEPADDDFIDNDGYVSYGNEDYDFSFEYPQELTYQIIELEDFESQILENENKYYVEFYDEVGDEIFAVFPEGELDAGLEGTEMDTVAVGGLVVDRYTYSDGLEIITNFDYEDLPYFKLHIYDDSIDTEMLLSSLVRE